MSANKPDTSATWHDPDDAPELTDDWFREAEQRHGDKVIRRGRPLSTQRKVSTTIRFDADVIEAFRSSGEGWQTRINNALREWLAARPR